MPFNVKKFLEGGGSKIIPKEQAKQATKESLQKGGSNNQTISRGSGGGGSYQGPVQQGVSEEIFRKTGRSIGGEGVSVNVSDTKTTQQQIPQAQQNVMTSAQSYYAADNYQLSLGEKIKQSAKASLSFETIGQRGFGEYTKNIYEPFESAKISSLARIEIAGPQNIAQRGTINTLQFDWTQPMSMSEFKYRADIEKGFAPAMAGLPLNVKLLRTSESISGGIQKELQEQIDVGKLDYSTEENKKAVDELAKQMYEERYAAASSQVISKSAFSEGAIRTYNPLKTAGKVAFVGGTLALSIPAVAGYEAAFLTTAGIGAFSLGSASKNIITAMNPKLEFSERLSEGITGGLKVAGGALAIGASKKILSGWNVKDISKYVESKPMRLTGKEILVQEKGAVYKISGEKFTPTGKLNIEYKLVSLRNVKPDKVMLSESGIPTIIERGSETQSLFLKGATARLKVYDFVSEKTITKTQTFGGGGRIIGFGESARVMRGKQGIELQGVQTGTGSFYLKLPTKEGFKSFKFYGVSKEAKDVYAVFGGNPKTLKFGKTIQVTGDVGYAGTIIKLGTNVEQDFALTSGFNQALKKIRAPSTAVSGITTEAEKLALPQLQKSLSPELSQVESRALQTTATTSQMFSTAQMPKTRTKGITSQMFSTAQMPKQKTTAITSQMFSTARMPRTKTASAVMFAQPQAFFEMQRIRQQTQNLLKSKYVFAPATSVGFMPNLEGLKFNLPKAKFGWDERASTKGFKLFGKRRYTPSYEAVVLNIRGKAPKGTETGARVRPITKGFSWENIRGGFMNILSGGKKRKKKKR